MHAQANIRLHEGKRVASVVRGFTLLELLLVMALTALMVAGVALALPSSGARQLQEDALRLAAQLEMARAQSRASGQRVWMQVDAQGWRWHGLPSAAAQTGLWLHAETQAQPLRVELGPEPVISAQDVWMWNQQGLRLRVTSDGVQPFAVAVQP